jgi:hypothetical protein
MTEVIWDNKTGIKFDPRHASELHPSWEEAARHAEHSSLKEQQYLSIYSSFKPSSERWPKTELGERLRWNSLGTWTSTNSPSEVNEDPFCTHLMRYWVLEGLYLSLKGLDHKKSAGMPHTSVYTEGFRNFLLRIKISVRIGGNRNPAFCVSHCKPNDQQNPDT